MPNSINRVRKQAESYADQARDYASHAYDRTRDAASAAYDRSAEAVEYAADKSSDFIRSYPLSTVLVALGVGISVGLLLGKIRS
jgi:ElaB/YqjD/DUF883 family membrane-anchored ribosome-binding protein